MSTESNKALEMLGKVIVGECTAEEAGLTADKLRLACSEIGTTLCAVIEDEWHRATTATRRVVLATQRRITEELLDLLNIRRMSEVQKKRPRPPYPSV